MHLASANGKEWGTRKEWRGRGERDVREEEEEGRRW